MIKDGFLYLAALIFAAAVLVNLPKIFKGKKAQVFFNFAPPIVLIYLGPVSYTHLRAHET